MAKIPQSEDASVEDPSVRRSLRLKIHQTEDASDRRSLSLKMPQVEYAEDPLALGCYTVHYNEDPSRRSLTKIPVTFNWG